MRLLHQRRSQTQDESSGVPAACIERVLDRLADERIGQILRLEELVVDRVDVERGDALQS